MSVNQFTGVILTSVTQISNLLVYTAICDLVAATNIHSLTSYSAWNCDSNHIPTTDICSPWLGITCSGSNIVSISVNSVGVVGELMLFIN